MRAKKSIALLLMMIMVITIFAGCSNAEKKDEPADETPVITEGTPDATEDAAATTDDAADTSFTVTDMTGREITFDAPVERVVALTAADCEIIYAIGAGDLLVGRGAFCDYPEDVLSVPAVDSGAETNIEEVIALAPQVVLMNTMAQNEEQIATLENAGIKCVVSEAVDIAGVYTAIEIIGQLTDKNDEAAAIITEMKATFEQITNDSAGDGSETIYFEVSSMQWGDPWTSGSGTFMDELATMVGVKNIFSDVEGWQAVSQEQVIDRNPDYILTIEMYFGDGPAPDEEILGREGWQDITAVKNGKVHNASQNEIARPGPRLADAAKELYNFIYAD